MNFEDMQVGVRFTCPAIMGATEAEIVSIDRDHHCVRVRWVEQGFVEAFKMSTILSAYVVVVPEKGG